MVKAPDEQVAPWEVFTATSVWMNGGMQNLWCISTLSDKKKHYMNTDIYHSTNFLSASTFNKFNNHCETVILQIAKFTDGSQWKHTGLH